MSPSGTPLLNLRTWLASRMRAPVISLSLGGHDLRSRPGLESARVEIGCSRWTTTPTSSGSTTPSAGAERPSARRVRTRRRAGGSRRGWGCRERGSVHEMLSCLKANHLGIVARPHPRHWLRQMAVPPISVGGTPNSPLRSGEGSRVRFSPPLSYVWDRGSSPLPRVGEGLGVRAPPYAAWAAASAMTRRSSSSSSLGR